MQRDLAIKGLGGAGLRARLAASSVAILGLVAAGPRSADAFGLLVALPPVQADAEDSAAPQQGAKRDDDACTTASQGYEFAESDDELGVECDEEGAEPLSGGSDRTHPDLPKGDSR